MELSLAASPLRPCLAQKLVKNSSLLQFYETNLHELAVELDCLCVFNFLVDIVHFCAVVRETHEISAQLVARINLYATQHKRDEKSQEIITLDLRYSVA